MQRPGVDLERALDHVRLGRVDHERRVDRLGEELRERAHLRALVVALVQRHAHVEHVRARRPPARARSGGGPA